MAASVAEHQQEIAEFEKLLDNFFQQPNAVSELDAVSGFGIDRNGSYSPMDEGVNLEKTSGSTSHISSNSSDMNNHDAYATTEAAPVSHTGSMLDILNAGTIVSFPNQQAPGVSLYAFNSMPKADSDSGNTKAEKSRSAQRRFRERRKEQMGALQEKFEQMSAQMEQLSVHNNELKQRSRVLQRLLRVQDEQKRVLEDNYTGQSICEAPTFGQLDMDPHPEFNRADMLEKFCPFLAAMARNKSDVEEARNMTPEKFIERWRKYLQEVSVHLLTSDADPTNTDIIHEMSKLTCDVTWMTKHVSILNSWTMQQVYCFDLERAAPAAAEPQHWSNVVQLIGFTDNQLADMRTALQLFQQRMAKVAAEMQEVTQAAAALGHTAQDHSTSYSSGTDADVQLVARLEVALKRQHEMMLQLKGFFFGTTITCLQFARTAVYSYPFFPDALAIMTTATGFVLGSGAAQGALPGSAPVPALQMGVTPLLPMQGSN